LDDIGRSKVYIIDHNPSWKENQRQKREFLDPRVTNITSGGHQQKGLNILFFNFFGQERLFRKVTSVSIPSSVEWLDTFSFVLRPADVTVKEVSHINPEGINKKA
jgi:hypothetical protein